MSPRASIKSYLLPYLDEIGSQLGTDDISEIVNTCLLDHKRGICRCQHSSSGSHQSSTASPSISPEVDLLEDLSGLLNNAL